MIPVDADTLIALAIELYPKTTDGRFALLRTMLLGFPDPKFARETLTGLATRTNDLDVPAVREALDRETARRGGKAADRDAIKAREAAILAARQNRDARGDEVDAVVLAMTDEQLAELKAEAVRQLPERINGSPSGPAREMYARMNPRKCYPLRVLIFGVLNGVPA